MQRSVCDADWYWQSSLPSKPTMAAQDLYDKLRGTIDEHLEADDELSTFELVGVLRMVTAELELAAMEAGEEG